MFPIGLQVMSDCGGKMGLAQANAAVNEERVVFFARLIGHCQRGGVSELIARTNDEFGEGVAGIELGTALAIGYGGC